jgi:acetyl-CoA carboxylase biotin carboxyl carrier protein
VELTSDDVRDILQLLDGLPFGEMHLQTARFSLCLRRTADGEWTQELQVTSEPAMTAAASAAAVSDGASGPAGGAAGAAGAAGASGTAEAAGGAGAAGGAAGGAGSAGAAAGAAAGEAAAERAGLRPVRAPLPGTFYRAPMPGAPPFVEVGSRVEPDTVVGIVETMKLMNSVAAGASGTVAEIPAGNAEFADRDAVLVWIREDP